MSWPGTREDFLEYIRFKKYDSENAVGMLSHLDRLVKVAETPMDIMRIFSDLSVGQQHHLNRAMRAWFRYY